MIGIKHVCVHGFSRGRNQLSRHCVTHLISREAVLSGKRGSEAVNSVGTYIHVLYLNSLSVFKIDGAEYTHSNESVNPIPAVRALDTASVYSIPCKRISRGIAHSLNRLDRRGEFNTQSVILRLQNR